MTEPHIPYISPSILFSGDMNDDNVALNQPLPIESHHMDLDLPDDQILESEFPWSVPGIFDTSLESEGTYMYVPPREEQILGQHVIATEDNPPLSESLMDLNLDLSLDFGDDFSLNALTALAQVSSLSGLQGPALSIPYDSSSHRSEIVSDVPKNAQRLDQTQLDTLNKWVADCNVPYPTRKEKLSLAKHTGLKISQISSWFSRVRQKRLKETHPKPPPIIHATNLHPTDSSSRFTGSPTQSAATTTSPHAAPCYSIAGPGHGPPAILTDMDFSPRYRAKRNNSEHATMSTRGGYDNLEEVEFPMEETSGISRLRIRQKRHAPSPPNGNCPQQGLSNSSDLIGYHNGSAALRLGLPLLATPLPSADAISPLLISNQRRFQVSTLSLPIALTKHIPSGANIRRSRSLPLHFTLDHLRKQLRRPMLRGPQKGSLDVVLSKHTERSSLISQKESMSTLGPQGSSTADYSPLQYHLKQSYIIEWLSGLPISVTEMAPLQQDETRPTSFDSLPTNPLNHNDYWLPWPRSSSSPGSHRHDLDKKEAGDVQDSASIAWSAGMSASSGGSQQSFGSLGSRKGRRIFAHANSSSESGSIRKRGREAFKEEIRRTKKSRPTRSYPPSSYREVEERVKKQRKYYCTFCDSVFSRPFLWKRHEESVHAPQQEWICGLNESSCDTPVPQEMSTTPDLATDLATASCPLCKEAAIYQAIDGIEVSNTCSHGFSECWAKPESTRTFYRKDTLHQHLVHVHTKIKGHSRFVQRLNLDQWSRPVETSGYDLKCHFCGAPNDSWNERYKHILAHFDEGITMDQWQPRYIIDYNQPENISLPPGLTQPGVQPLQMSDNVEGNMYAPQWYRNTSDGLAGWCEWCRPGRWLRLNSYWFKHDRSIKHGISMKTGTTFPEPVRTRWSITHGIEGLCAQCDSWIVLEKSALGDESWFTHSFLCEFETATPEDRRQLEELWSFLSNGIRKRDNMDEVGSAVGPTMDLQYTGGSSLTSASCDMYTLHSSKNAPKSGVVRCIKVIVGC
ncbi:hypothetical protein F5B22DRAFT_622267 [Xylaria bambusicola]|uniref:uncharacterized protein n=1 Tax=Xylaria bambusicola TaxID=326684 RepID=UPI0020084D4E|nr:uncharacterized protein F5B22DRAFT_622267 [Xylaria bambusicola]KAI0506849.1 hypothetical protein F5B22DRAFT_622267 [Xylaria bambusicola]